MIALANFSVVRMVAADQRASFQLFHAVWPIVLVSTVAVILVMSLLYHALGEIMKELADREKDAVILGLHDALTGLANRVLLNDRLAMAIERQFRNQEDFAILMLDLDHFKTVNDVMGHHAGDQLLQGVAGRLREMLRETDTIARLGGDEFVIIQANVGKAGAVRRLCSRLVKELSKPFEIDGRPVTVGVSIGCTLSDRAGSNVEEYMRRSDIALYKAKKSGRNCYRFFSIAMDAQVQRRARIENDLRAALKRGEGLEVHFQPQVDRNGVIQGVESLLRWFHPVFGNLPPSEIVPIAEEIGLINAVGEFVFREACRVAGKWPDLFVAVNISMKQFSRSSSLSERFKNIAAEANVPTKRIELELTETALVRRDDCGSQITTLRAHGFRIALDDFGTGLSSLSSLRRFQVDKIKLDKSFADDTDRHRNIAILKSAVMLAHTLGLEVVAEGIENVEQEEVAIQAGCDGLQGYRYAQPMTEQDLGIFLSQSVEEAA
jgi:diguanylate cyclase (GGDEF)-like protein